MKLTYSTYKLPYFHLYNIISIIICVTLVYADQLSKSLVLSYTGKFPIIITNFLAIRLVFNTGISFGLLKMESDTGVLCLAISSLVISLVILYYWIKSCELIEKVSLVLILSGAIGNVMDRLSYGKVIDFIDFHINGLHWYIFNLADSCVFLGFLGITWYNFKMRGFIKPHRKIF